MNYLKYSFFLLFFIIIGCGQTTQNDNLELIGHRGATGLVPENTIPGFKKALEYPVDGLEMDVVISGDDRVVVSHEPYFRHDICTTPEGESITEDTQMDHLLYEMNYSTIAEYDCGSLQNPAFPNQENEVLSKPLLNEVITEVESYISENDLDPTIYNVEIKSKPKWDGELQPAPEVTTQLVYDALTELKITDRVRIFAFDTRVLNALQEIDSSIPQVYLIPKRKTDMQDNLSLLTDLPDVYAPNYSIVDSSLVEKAHEEGMQVIPWTVNDYEDMERVIDLGVDGIISDYPNYYEKIRE